jgi:competence protein ComGC
LARLAFSIRQRGGCIHRLAAFTLLEIFSAIVVILILLTLMLPAYDTIRARMDKIACSNNLRQLLRRGMDRGIHALWRRASLMDLPHDRARISAARITPRRRIIGPITSRCPSIASTSPRSNGPRLPWFVERGNVHGNGNLMIQSNGAVVELTQMKLAHSQPAPSP